MKLKKLLAAVTAAALAVTTMAVTSFTASAAEDMVLTTNQTISSGTFKYVAATETVAAKLDGLNINVLDDWNNATDISNYSGIEIVYEATDWGNSSFVAVYYNGGSLGYANDSTWSKDDGETTRVFKFPEAGGTVNQIGFQIGAPSLAEGSTDDVEFTGNITVKSLKLIAKASDGDGDGDGDGDNTGNTPPPSVSGLKTWSSLNYGDDTYIVDVKGNNVNPTDVKIIELVLSGMSTSGGKINVASSATSNSWDDNAFLFSNTPNPQTISIEFGVTQKAVWDDTNETDVMMANTLSFTDSEEYANLMIFPSYMVPEEPITLVSVTLKDASGNVLLTLGGTSSGGDTSSDDNSTGGNTSGSTGGNSVIMGATDYAGWYEYVFTKNQLFGSNTSATTITFTGSDLQKVGYNSISEGGYKGIDCSGTVTIQVSDIDLSDNFFLHVGGSAATAVTWSFSGGSSGGNTPSNPSTPSTPSNSFAPSGSLYDPSTPAGTASITMVDSILASSDVSVSFNLGSSTKLDKEVFEAIAAKGGVTVKFNVAGGAYWEINGANVTNAKAVDLGVRMNSNLIPEGKVSEFAGDKTTIQLSLRHNGDFGFTGVLNVPINKSYNGKYANLYYYNGGKFDFVGSSAITGGRAKFAFSHASNYLIVIDDYAYGEDVSSAAGMTETTTETNSTVPYVAVLVVIAAFGASAIVLKKRLSK